MEETRDSIDKTCQGTEKDKIQIVREYEQKYKPVIEFTKRNTKQEI